MNDTQVVIQTGNWKVKVILGLGGLLTIIILAFMYRVEIGIVILTLGAVGAIRLGFWAKNKYTLEKLEQRQLTAQTTAIELETRLTYWRMRQEEAIAKKMAHESLFVETKSGTFALTNVQYNFYPSATASAQLASAPPALPAPALDYFTAMSDPLQAYAIVGAQRVGKSILAQHLTQHLTGLGRVCIVIGTKAEKSEWLNCKRFIGNDEVPPALGRLLAELSSRLADNRKTPIICTFLDDWINSTVLDGNLAEQFFVEASTRFLSAGIVPYFLLQSDSKADWGTKHGATLKNNFVHLLLTAPRVNGQLDHNRLMGAIMYPGDKEQHPVNLPKGLPMFGDSEPAIELAALLEPEPTEHEQQILDLYDSGESVSAIAAAVYGYKGGPQSAKVKSILDKFGRGLEG